MPITRCNWLLSSFLLRHKSKKQRRRPEQIKDFIVVRWHENVGLFTLYIMISIIDKYDQVCL
jgi:hypothetical protein